MKTNRGNKVEVFVVVVKYLLYLIAFYFDVLLLRSLAASQILFAVHKQT